MSILYVGIDRAKNVFAAHGVNETGVPRATLAQGRTRQAGRVDRAAAALHDRHGSLLRCASLGTPVPGSRSHGSRREQAKCLEIRMTVAGVIVQP